MTFDEYKAAVTIANTENWFSYVGLERVQWAAGVLLRRDVSHMEIPELTSELIGRMQDFEAEIDEMEESEIVQMANKVAQDFEGRS